MVIKSRGDMVGGTNNKRGEIEKFMQHFVCKAPKKGTTWESYVYIGLKY
jgi:hypothetical protein